MLTRTRYIYNIQHRRTQRQHWAYTREKSEFTVVDDDNVCWEAEPNPVAITQGPDQIRNRTCKNLEMLILLFRSFEYLIILRIRLIIHKISLQVLDWGLEKSL